MPPPAASPVAIVPTGTEIQPIDAYHRRHRTFPASGLVVHLTNRLQDLFEVVIAHGSRQEDKPVFDSRHFPWVKEVEAAWPQVRAELDTVMQHREAMPSFQDIVKEVGLIQRDDQWKTFFLKGVGMDCVQNARH